MIKSQCFLLEVKCFIKKFIERKYRVGKVEGRKKNRGGNMWMENYER